MVRWVALFSRTGSELKAICEKLNRSPDIIFTNNKSIDSKDFPKSQVIIASPDVIHNHLRVYGNEYDLVTLHGYMRIIPEDICNNHKNMYNSHPGLISEFPELKGKDPQQKAIDMQLPYTGNVIHKVTPGVDEGEILKVSRIVYNIQDFFVDELVSILRDLAVDNWVEFLEDKFEAWN